MTSHFPANIHGRPNLTRRHNSTQTMHSAPTTKLKSSNYELLTLFDVNINKLFCSFKSFLQQAFCPAKDSFHDLRDAIEYIESKDLQQTESESDSDGAVTISDIFAVSTRLGPGILLMKNVNASQLFCHISFSARLQSWQSWTNSIWQYQIMNCIRRIPNWSMNYYMIWPHGKSYTWVCLESFNLLPQ